MGTRPDYAGNVAAVKVNLVQTVNALMSGVTNFFLASAALRIGCH